MPKWPTTFLLFPTQRLPGMYCYATSQPLLVLTEVQGMTHAASEYLPKNMHIYSTSHTI